MDNLHLLDENEERRPEWNKVLLIAFPQQPEEGVDKEEPLRLEIIFWAVATDLSISIGVINGYYLKTVSAYWRGRSRTF